MESRARRSAGDCRSRAWVFVVGRWRLWLFWGSGCCCLHCLRAFELLGAWRIVLQRVSLTAVRFFTKGGVCTPPPPPAHPYFVQAALSYESCPNPIMHDACIVPLPQHPQQRLSHPHQQHSHRLGRSQQHLPWHLLACRPPIAYRWSESTGRLTVRSGKASQGPVRTARGLMS